MKQQTSAVTETGIKDKNIINFTEKTFIQYRHGRE